jgi:hypothetical protein
MDFKGVAANFTDQLRSFFAVIEVNILMRRLAVYTGDNPGNR